jgi:hypothetical protein
MLDAKQTTLAARIEGRLNQAVTHLHEQQDAIAALDPRMPPRSLLRLHSIGLRQLSWLEKNAKLWEHLAA